MLATAAATAAAVAAPSVLTRAQGAVKYRRRNVADPEAARDLASYKKAIRKMLELPPEDPRNWYRNAFVHTLDCPHGNWWFVVWHRGYIGWFEQICRELSGDPDFALPYWDWTVEPRVPAVMFEDVLTPTNAAYISPLKYFRATYERVLAAYWKGLSEDQIDQLLVRGLRFPEDLWFDIGYPKGPMFFDRDHARGLTSSKPDLDEKTAQTVSLSTLLDALSPRDFIGFGSPKTLFHSGLTGFGVLEGQPHNKVHNNVGGITTTTNAKGDLGTTDVGGFMQANLSPVDPIFFLHHANIDRIWDLWTRKQQARGYPILPTGSDYDQWSDEKFLFFVDAKGRAVGKTTAGDYEAIGDFDYDYQPGSGEEVVPVTVAAQAPRAVRHAATQIANPSFSATRPADVAVTLPPALLGAGTEPDAPRLRAKITVVLPPLAHASDIAVLVNAPADSAGAGPSSPHFAGTFSMFGRQIMRGPVSFAMPLTRPLAMLRERNLLGTDKPLNLRLFLQPRAMPARHAEMTAELLSVEVEEN